MTLIAQALYRERCGVALEANRDWNPVKKHWELVCDKCWEKRPRCRACGNELVSSKNSPNWARRQHIYTCRNCYCVRSRDKIRRSAVTVGDRRAWIIGKKGRLVYHRWVVQSGIQTYIAGAWLCAAEYGGD